MPRTSPAFSCPPIQGHDRGDILESDGKTFQAGQQRDPRGVSGRGGRGVPKVVGPWGRPEPPRGCTSSHRCAVWDREPSPTDRLIGQRKECHPFTQYLIHSFNTHLLRTCCVPGAVPGSSHPAATEMDKTLNYLQAKFMPGTSRMCEESHVSYRHEQVLPGAERAGKAVT